MRRDSNRLSYTNVMPLNCRIELLGGIRVLIGSRVVDRFQTQRTAALLAYLVLENGKQIPREQMAGILWPGGESTSIRNRLNQAVSSLRRQLHPPEMGGAEVLLANYHSVGINMGVTSADVNIFEQTLREAETSKDIKTRTKLLTQGVEMFTGPCLPGFSDEWAIIARGRYDRMYLGALDMLVRTYSRTGQPEQAVQFALKRAVMQPSDEGIHVTIVELFLRANDTAAARRYYAEAEQILLANRVHLSPGWLTLKEKVGSASRSGGSKLPRPSAAQKLTIDFAEAEAHVPIVRQVVRPRVPRALNSFVGRTEELERMSSRLHEGARLLTLYGLPGVGRARLANEFAASVQESGEYDVVFCTLTGESDSEQHLETIAQALIGSRDRPRDPLAQIVDHAPSRSTLLVLQHAERATSNFCSDIERLLQAVPQLVILLVAGEPTYIAGEVQLAIQPFTVPDRLETRSLAEIAMNPAVRLFVDRAQAVRPDFQLTPRVQQAVIDTCRHLDGIPLLLEFAAYWVRSLTVTQILDNLKTRSGFLEQRRRDVAPRQRMIMATLENVIALAHEDLGPVLSRLQVFEAGWDHEAGNILCEGLQYHECMDSLLERSLIVRINDRHSMLSLVKQFVQERTSLHEIKSLQSLHASIFAKRAEAIQYERGDLRDHMVDYPNYSAAIRCFLHRNEPESAARMAFQLGKLWESGALFPEALELIASIREQLGQDERSIGRAYLNAVEGRVRWLQGHYPDAVRCLEESLASFTENKAFEESLWPLCDLIAELHRRKQFDEARQLIDQALKLSQHSGNLLILGRVFLSLGNAATDQRRYSDAEHYYRRSLALAEQQGSPTRISMAQINLANLMVMTGRPELALKQVEASYEDLDQIDTPWVQSMSLLTYAKINRSVGRLQIAMTAIAQALELVRHEGLVRWRIIAEAARIAAALQQIPVAIQLLAFAERANILLVTREPGAEFDLHYDTVDQIRREVSDEVFQQNWLRGEWLRESEVTAMIERMAGEVKSQESV